MKKEVLVRFREAKKEDCEILWRWRNEKETKKFSLNDKFIPLEEHKKWFYNKLKSSDTKIYIMLNDSEKPVGQVRLDIFGKDAEIDISVDSKERAKGYGTIALNFVKDIAIRELNVKQLIGYIKQNNVGSLKVFNKSGYNNKGIVNFKDNKAVKMVFKI